jgi:hypothetical protein
MDAATCGQTSRALHQTQLPARAVKPSIYAALAALAAL